LNVAHSLDQLGSLYAIVIGLKQFYVISKSEALELGDTLTPSALVILIRLKINYEIDVSAAAGIGEPL